MVGRELVERGASSPVSSSQMAGEPVLEVRQLARSFGATRALVSASLTVHQGTIHALAGENGSGKSTLVKVISGALRPDAGAIEWCGRAFEATRPAAARAAGIATVFQETLIADEMSVRDNVFLGTHGFWRVGRSKRAEERLAREILGDLGLGSVDPERPAWSLSLAQRQIVTIARALAQPWRLLVLDESTSALDTEQLTQLFAYLRRERDAGRSILLTSHRMSELQELADDVTVLRVGETLGTRRMVSMSAHEMLGLMAGRESDGRTPGVESNHAPGEIREGKSAQPPVLRVEGLSLGRGGIPIDLTLHTGEIMGLAGLEGQGQVALAECVCGLRRPHQGRAVICSDDGSGWPVRDFRSAHGRGIAFVPRDRKEEGLFLPLSTWDNFSTLLNASLVRLGVIRRSAVMEEYRRYADLLRVQAQPGTLVTSLSGGTQQKILLARWLATRSKILVLNDAFRGVDANTKQELYPILLQLAAEGLTILLVSTEVAELLALCDRVAVFHDGAMSALLSRGDATEATVIAAMFGHTARESGDG